MDKVCKSCMIKRDIEEFRKTYNKDKTKQYIRSSCNECVELYNKKYRKENKKLIAIQEKEYRDNNKAKIKFRQKEYMLNNKEIIEQKRKNKYLENRDFILERRKSYYRKNRESEINRSLEYIKNNKEKVAKTSKRWRDININKVRERRNNYCNTRYENDNNYKILCLLRCRIRLALSGKDKSDYTVGLLGCSLDEFKNHLQETAINNGYLEFDINNYNGKEYHIDHVVPCCSFDLSVDAEQRKCFHWSNMQILTSKENLEKGNKI